MSAETERSNLEIVFEMTRTPIATTTRSEMPESAWYAIVTAAKLGLPVIALHIEDDDGDLVSFQAIGER